MSGDFKIVDHATFEKLQQSTSTTSTPNSALKIRNAKYRRVTQNRGFDLMQFVRTKVPKEAARCRRGRQRSAIVPNKVTKKGKQNETGKKRIRSRLKKSILRYRQIKRERECQLQQQLDEITEKVQELAVSHHNNSKNLTERRGVTHSRKFREYCSNLSTPELKKHTEDLLRELNHFQRRAHAQNEVKARAHRRFVVGFRQVQTCLRINKVKLVVIATDCEMSEGEGGLDQTISDVKSICHDQKIPIAFVFERRKLAYILYKRASISCVGILDYDGAREIFSQLIVALNRAQESYEKLATNFPNHVIANKCKTDIQQWNTPNLL